MLLYLFLIFAGYLFVVQADNQVTWNRTKLEANTDSYHLGIEPSWSQSNLTLGSEVCPGGYSLVGSKCLMFVTFIAQPYGEARQFCHAAKGELAAITTATDFKTLVDYIHANDFTNGEFWLDGTDEAAEGVWVTSSGEAVPLGTPFWAAFGASQQPDNVNGKEHCLYLPPAWFFYMGDNPCSAVKNFICEATIQTQKKAASAALAPFGPSAVGGRVTCPMLFVEVGGLCILFITWEEETWEDARQACAGASSDLLAITNVEVFRALYLYIHLDNLSGHGFWLGGSDIESEGIWVYTTGELVPMGTPFWGLYEMNAPVQEPNGGTSQNCLAITGDGFYNLRDYSCTSKFNPLCCPLMKMSMSKLVELKLNVRNIDVFLLAPRRNLWENDFHTLPHISNVIS
ncbi:macrophage mannose receptor 1-like [Penaeus monodon]|uniref:macrophage mannose receptor 1-like n=1 Tax=Penaeus monodon TaxID=6687 RepID=UPI0018A775EC|nr:macrophage mannose receptor 1-like [Penaeus monodon]